MRSRLIFLAVVVVAVLAGVAAASVVSDATRKPQTAAERDPAPREQPNVAARTANPAGGPDIGVVLYRNDAGRTCMAQGELSGERVGATHDGKFTAMPLEDGGTCGPDPDPVALHTETPLIGRSAHRFTTVWGRARADVTGIDVVSGDARARVRLQKDGAFIATLPNDLHEGARITVTLSGGETEVIELPPTPSDEQLNAPPRPGAGHSHP